MGEAIEDLHHHVAKLVLNRLCELRGRHLRQDSRERPEVAAEKVEVFGGVGYLQAVSDLHGHL